MTSSARSGSTDAIDGCPGVEVFALETRRASDATHDDGTTARLTRVRSIHPRTKKQTRER